MHKYCEWNIKKAWIVIKIMVMHRKRKTEIVKLNLKLNC